MDLWMLLLLIASLVYAVTWMVMRQVFRDQERQLAMERLKVRIGLVQDFKPRKEEGYQRCNWCALGRTLGPTNLKEIASVQQQLSRAGFRQPNAFGAYFFLKYVLVLGSALVTVVLWSWWAISPIWLIGVPTVMLLLPERVLIYLGNNRLARINMQLPDFLDMSNICMNAGLSYMVAMKRVTQELREIAPEVCSEFDYLLDQIQIGVPRTEALRQFAERNPTKDIESLVQMLIQNEKLGSSISEAINEFSRRMYLDREQVMQEKAAKTSAKMALVIMPFLMIPYLILLLAEQMVQFGRSF
jgi:Flp pilus assembly protein TadB